MILFSQCRKPKQRRATSSVLEVLQKVDEVTVADQPLFSQDFFFWYNAACIQVLSQVVFFSRVSVRSSYVFARSSSIPDVPSWASMHEASYSAARFGDFLGLQGRCFSQISFLHCQTSSTVLCFVYLAVPCTKCKHVYIHFTFIYIRTFTYTHTYTYNNIYIYIIAT